MKHRVKNQVAALLAQGITDPMQIAREINESPYLVARIIKDLRK